MKGIILAGGRGTRLQPLTNYRPKPKIPIVNKPIMEYTIQLLKKYEVTEIAILIHYKGEMIQSYFGNGEQFGVKLHYFWDNPPLGTAGSVKAIESFFDETCIVISGDILTNTNLIEAYLFHTSHHHIMTIIMKREEITKDFGVVTITPEGKVTGFVEKPKKKTSSNHINTGIYILEPQICTYIEPERFSDFGNHIIPYLLSKKQVIYGYVMDGYWLDIGTLLRYEKGKEDILAGKMEEESISSIIIANNFSV